VLVRTSVPELTLVGAIRNTIRDIDAGLPMSRLSTMRAAVDPATVLQRVIMSLAAGFAGMTLTMATLGLAGVIAYAVSRRRREIGLRIALGASGADVSRAVIRNAVRRSRQGRRSESCVRWRHRECWRRCSIACSRTIRLCFCPPLCC
jgi:putative ABC transport system permease protein